MDTESLLRSLNAHKVRYVIIGAAAFPVHGYSRATTDIDIFINATPENAENTLVALREFGYDVSNIGVGDILGKKILLRKYVIEADIHPYVKGVTFRSVWDSRVSSRIGLQGLLLQA